MAQQELNNQKKFGGIKNESKTVGQTYVRQMQGYQKRRQSYGYLFQEQEPQTKTRLILRKQIIGDKKSFQILSPVILSYKY